MGLWGKAKALFGIKNWKDGGREQLREAAIESVTTGTPLQDVATVTVINAVLNPERVALIETIRANYYLALNEAKQHTALRDAIEDGKEAFEQLVESFRK